MYKKTQSLYISLRCLPIFLFFVFSGRAPVLLLHVLIDCSLRVSWDPAQQFANPPVIITPQPSLRGTGFCSVISVCRWQQPPRNTFSRQACYTVRIQEEASHLGPFQNHSLWGIGCCSFMSSGLILILREKGSQTLLNHWRWWSVFMHGRHRITKCGIFLFHQSDIDNAELHLGKSTPALVSHSSFICSFDHSEKWFVRWDEHSGAKPQPALMKGNC